MGRRSKMNESKHVSVCQSPSACMAFLCVNKCQAPLTFCKRLQNYRMLPSVTLYRSLFNSGYDPKMK